jgi:hypothetical protein
MTTKYGGGYGGGYEDLLNSSQKPVDIPIMKPGNHLSILAGGSTPLFLPFKGGENLANTHAGLGDTIRQAGANSKFDALVGGKVMRRKQSKQSKKSKKQKSKARKSKKSRATKRRN